MSRFRIHYTLEGRSGCTDVDGSDIEAIRTWFKRAYPLALIDKVKVIRS